MKKMELGSEYPLNLSDYRCEVQDNIFMLLSGFHAAYFDSGRSAVRAAESMLPGGKVLLPAYICKSVIEAFRGREIVFYNIDKDFNADILNLAEKVEDEPPAILYMLSYWGKRFRQDILEDVRHICKAKNIAIIEDTTHSIFSELNAVGDLCVCSLRKWFPIARGGVLYSRNALKLENDIDNDASEIKMAAMLMKQLYIEGRLECNELYRQVFMEDAKELDRCCRIQQLPPFSEFILRRSSIWNMIEKRKKNYQLLSESADRFTSFSPAIRCSEEEVPFAYPVYADNRNEFRSFLMKSKIYCAIHWPIEDERQKKFSHNAERMEHMISIPLDQRHGREHMIYLLDVLEKWDKVCRE